MSIIEEINKSHISIRAFAITLFIIPFWYFSTYLFGNDFFKSADNFVILSFCLIVSFSSSVLLYLFIDKVGDLEKSKEPMLDNMSVTVVLICFWLLILILTVYSLDFFFKIKIYFYYYVLIYYAPIIIFNTLQLLFGVDKRK